MMRTYTVTLDDDTVGNATLEEQGLYYRIHCRCRLHKKQLVSLYAGGEDLGILVPDNGFFCLTTKVPQKRIARENITFRLVRKDTAKDNELIPVSTDAAFLGVDRLREASFVLTADGPMIKLPIKRLRPAE